MLCQNYICHERCCLLMKPLAASNDMGCQLMQRPCCMKTCGVVCRLEWSSIKRVSLLKSPSTRNLPYSASLCRAFTQGAVFWFACSSVQYQRCISSNVVESGGCAPKLLPLLTWLQNAGILDGWASQNSRYIVSYSSSEPACAIARSINVSSQRNCIMKGVF